MIILYVNPIGKSITLMIIETDTSRILKSEIIKKTGNDFEIIPKVFVDLSKEYSLKEIWCITGPGPFTLLRIITLILNSISYNDSNIILKSGHYFELLRGFDATPILQANKHEYLIKTSNAIETIIKIEDLPLGKFIGYIDEISIPGYTEYHENIETIMNMFSQRENIQRLSPLYIKAPNITLGSQKTSVHTSMQMKNS
ncbi:hypothetical protein KBD33_01760 [Candidatus Gracilibacteria bacterium]|nr:hypothetical protein [Candidatus Gracilibacteria bacterium]